MKLIDTNTGQMLFRGTRFKNVNGEMKILSIKPFWYLLKVKVKYQNNPPYGAYHEIWIPIRFTHPQFLFESVAFFPS